MSTTTTEITVQQLSAVVGEVKANELDRMFPVGDEVRQIIFASYSDSEGAEQAEHDASDAALDSTCTELADELGS